MLQIDQIHFGCNAMYVEDAKDGRIICTHIFVLIFKKFSIRKRLWKAETYSFPSEAHVCYYIITFEDVKDFFDLQHVLHAST